MKRKNIIIFLIFLFSLCCSIYALEKNESDRILTVTGQGEETIQTTLANIKLAVEVIKDKAVAVNKETAKLSNSVIDMLKNYPVEHLETTGISLQPKYDYKDNSKKLTGYIGINYISFRVNIDKAGLILDEAVKAGASRIDDVSFIADDKLIVSAKEKALVKATENAKSKADIVLKTLGLKEVEIVKINIDNSYYYESEVRTFSVSMKSSADPTPVIGGEQKVKASVNLSIKY